MYIGTVLVIFRKRTLTSNEKNFKLNFVNFIDDKPTRI